MGPAIIYCCSQVLHVEQLAAAAEVALNKGTLLYISRTVNCRYETSNHLWLILEYCVGGDLLSLLRQDVRLPETSIHDIGRDLLVSLQYLHASSVIFCDLKPSNILLDENGRIKLGGFGFSLKLADINKNLLQQTLVRMPLGAPPLPLPRRFPRHTHSTSMACFKLANQDFDALQQTLEGCTLPDARSKGTY